jgi:hypothetical protein
MAPDKFEPAESFSYDLLDHWQSHAEAPEPGSPWRYHGTATLAGVTGALAWRRGSVGIAVTTLPVCELGLFERMQIGHDMKNQALPGWETVPPFL